MRYRILIYNFKGSEYLTISSVTSNILDICKI